MQLQNKLTKKRKELEDKIRPIIERAEAEKALDEYIKYLKNRLQDESDPINKLPSSELKKVKEAVEKSNQWYQKNPYSEKVKIDEQIKELDEKVRPVVEKVDSQEKLEETLKEIKEKMKDPNIVSRIKKR